MFKCNHCDAIFDEPEVKKFTEMEEFWGAMVPRTYEELYCPECGDEDIEEYEGSPCDECEYYGTDECDDCPDKEE